MSDASDGFAPERWFAAPIWSRRVVGAAALNTDLLTVLARLKRDTDSVRRSNVGGWHSHDQVHRRDDVAAIRRVIGTTAARCAQTLGFDFGGHDIEIREMWFNENRRGDFTTPHVHPGAFLSGVYYVQAGPDAGNIEFHDPVHARQMTSFPVAAPSSEIGRSVEYRAEAGTLLIFPAWLQHGVQPNGDERSRVSISFNIGYRAKRAVD